VNLQGPRNTVNLLFVHYKLSRTYWWTWPQWIKTHYMHNPSAFRIGCSNVKMWSMKWIWLITN